jgi:hypothetical protein
MRNTLLALLFLFNLTIVHGQLSGVYIAAFRKKVEYYLRFSKDGQYYIDMTEHLTNDVLDNRTMSIGHYFLNGKEVSLIDKIHNFQIKLVIVNDSLKMKNSFCFMNNLTFGFKSNYVDTHTLNWLKDYDSISIKKDIAEYIILNRKLYPLVFGDYSAIECVQCAFEYRLTILRDCTYSLYFKDLLISKGNWNREGVELILYDKSLEHKFYLMIGKRVLISKLLPGDYKSVILKRK